MLFVDVGQGDGIILRLPNGAFVVIDANQNEGGKMADILAELGCREIAAMVMTHPHADHIGGLPDILHRFKVKRFYDPGVPYPSSIYKRVLTDVEQGGGGYVIPKPGDTLAWDTHLRITVVSGGKVLADNVNNASIVLHIEFDSTSLLLTGDAEQEAEQEMIVNFHGRLHSDILKVGHHGSRSSSKPPFLREVGAHWGVISCGIGNVYKHPKAETLKNLHDAGITFFRTDEQGTILARSDGRAWKIGPADPNAPRAASDSTP